MVTNDSLEVMKLRRCMDTLNINHNLIEADNGEDALITLGELADTNMLPNAIIVDINASKMDGFELLNIFKSDPILKNIPSVILTNCDTHTEMIEELRINVTGNIRKQLKYSEYLKEVKSLFEFFQINRISTAS